MILIILKKEKKIRMKDLMNIEIESVNKAIKAKYAKEQKEVYDIRKIHFVTNDNIPCKILRDDGTTDNGLCEGYCKNINAGEIIQFERYGFVILLLLLWVVPTMLPNVDPIGSYLNATVYRLVPLLTGVS